MESYCVLEKHGIEFDSYNSSIIIYPPKKITCSFYKCDNKFHLNLVLNMYDENVNNYGIALLSGKEYRCYVLSLSSCYQDLKLVASGETKLQKKHKKGGSSQNRYLHTQQDKKELYIKKLAEVLRSSYMKENNTILSIKGILIAGCGSIKNQVMNSDIFKQYFSDAVIGVINTEEINDSTINTICKR